MSSANASSADQPVGNFEQPVLAISHPQAFQAVRQAIEGSFSSGKVAGFLKSLGNGSLRVRDFEAVLDRGLLGVSAKAEYQRLNDGDQGQIREFYLATLEKVTPEVRQRFFKLYAYY